MKLKMIRRRSCSTRWTPSRHKNQTKAPSLLLLNMVEKFVTVNTVTMESWSTPTWKETCPKLQVLKFKTPWDTTTRPRRKGASTTSQSLITKSSDQSWSTNTTKKRCTEKTTSTNSFRQTKTWLDLFINNWKMNPRKKMKTIMNTKHSQTTVRVATKKIKYTESHKWWWKSWMRRDWRNETSQEAAWQAITLAQDHEPIPTKWETLLRIRDCRTWKITRLKFDETIRKWINNKQDKIL